jgi:hypothetical protein
VSFRILLFGPDGSIASRADLTCEDEEVVAKEQARQLTHDCEKLSFGRAPD